MPHSRANENDINFISIFKYSIAALFISLISGVAFYYLSWFAVEYAGVLLARVSFVFSVVIVVGLLSAHMENTDDAIIMGLIVALFTGILESSIISMFMGQEMGAWFMEFIGNQTSTLIIVGVVVAYVGNAYLKDKIHLGFINRFLGK